MSSAAVAPRPPQRPAPGRPPGVSRTNRSRPTNARTVGSRAATARIVAPEIVAPRPRMRVVQRPDLTPRRMGFAVSCTALLGTLMLGLLMLNVTIAGNAFTEAELTSQRSLLVEKQQALEQQLLVQAAPSALADKATALGMVPAEQTIVLAPDGTGAPPLTTQE